MGSFGAAMPIAVGALPWATLTSTVLPIVNVALPDALAPATAEELCEICAVLHQQSAAPLAFATPPVPCCTGVATRRSEADPIGRTHARVFQARAPPGIESTT